MILGFGIWILADKTSFIAVLRKNIFLHLLSPSELTVVRACAWPWCSLGTAVLLCMVRDLSSNMVYSKMGLYQGQGEREQP